MRRLGLNFNATRYHFDVLRDYRQTTQMEIYNFPREKQENFLKMKWILSKNGKFLNFKTHSNGNFF
jgi:hypothetical protein